MKWLLIFTVVYTNGGSSITVEDFDTEAECRAAGKRAIQYTRWVPHQEEQWADCIHFKA